MQEDSNKITLTTYNNHTADYIRATPSSHDGVVQQWLILWIDRALAEIKKGGHVLEIGSATPRDANYIRSKGYSVQCSDATPNFVEHLKSLGEPALTINVTEDKIEGKYDMIYANAVFPHLTDTQVDAALENIYQALNNGGVLAFNIKQGEDDEWVNEKFNDKRYINYWQPHEICDAVVHAGFTLVAVDDGVQGDLPTHVWTHIIAQKSES
ncbi:MAG: class I SAM-dependent methyltransferase [Candidatus Saccharibacteria bacterium]|nr:MAG: class I SAM-dependent methyltransferase [Candidatus Saccharibacteria bacterium]